jgi:hypothetical protein
MLMNVLSSAEESTPPEYAMNNLFGIFLGKKNFMKKELDYNYLTVCGRKVILKSLKSHSGWYV